MQHYSNILSNRLNFEHLEVYICLHKMIYVPSFQKIRMHYSSFSRKITFTIEFDSELVQTEFFINHVQYQQNKLVMRGNLVSVEILQLPGDGIDRCSIQFHKKSDLSRNDGEMAKVHLKNLADTLNSLFSAIDTYNQNPYLAE